MDTIIMCVEYDGTDYFGWQIQPGQKTIQGELNRAIKQAFGIECLVVGSGRTDAGVHSSGQVCHFNYDEIKVPRHKIRLAINQKLPLDIRVKRLWFTNLDFHSRFDAVLREYRYRFSRHTSVFERRFTTFIPYQLDISMLYKCAKLFEGRHNFFSFSKNHSQMFDYYCDVKKCEWITVNDNFELSIIADRFVYGMVRALVGTMIDVARYKRSLDSILVALDTFDRRLSSSFAPPFGLDLYKIYYESPFDCIIV
jgi:tRNA pseudouridine38-40 synthase